VKAARHCGFFFLGWRDELRESGDFLWEMHAFDLARGDIGVGEREVLAGLWLVDTWDSECEWTCTQNRNHNSYLNSVRCSQRPGNYGVEGSYYYTLLVLVEKFSFSYVSH
jgi:hypothetical protein